MLNIAILGCGYWGKNLIRAFLTADVNIRYVMDRNDDKLNAVKKLRPSITVTKHTEDIFKDPSVDAVVVALPASEHYKTAKAAIEHDKHVLVEKPMADSLSAANEIAELADKKEKILMCDHTFLYTDSVRKIRELIQQGSLGSLQYYDSVRYNLGRFQLDVNVLGDLAVHDFSILNYICDKLPHSVSATGISHTGNIEDIAYVTLFYEDNFIAHINVSWISPIKIRKVLIGGSKKMLLFDDTEPIEKLTIYNSGYAQYIENERIKYSYHTGDVDTPILSAAEALVSMAQDFISAINNHRSPVSDSKAGIDTMILLDAVQKSVKLNGREILIG
ncbi:MAG: Gfo/Idh/MocA family oxidoreductase [Syntrophomonadaceae bacterium]|jgi:predicted dehydrogenase|nr:Gfo/Idh/MocA family oxidoreductase [Syntrophomonadaceae bacterium]